MDLLAWIFVLAASAMTCARAAQPKLTMDQLLMNAADTSRAFDFIQNDDTVLIELDIKVKKDEWKEIEEYGLAKTEKRRRRALSRIKRKGIHGNRWTGKTVPYVIARYFKDAERTQINKALAEYHEHTCLTFRERRSESNYISFVDGGGCSSFVGMKGGEQEVTLGRGCRQHGIIMHEVGHAMGLHHEQTRPDRDSYVTIQQQNIPPNVYFNFQKFTAAVIKPWGIPYDYTSIMHYGETAFSYNGRATIVAKDERFQKKMGNRDGFSFRDIKLLNTMYQCDSGCRSKPTCPGEAYVDKSCRCMCPGTNGKPTKVCQKGDTGKTDQAVRKVTTDTSTDTSAGASCTDKRGKECATWKSRGFCTNDAYTEFMNKNCQKSCGHCEEKEEEECKDLKGDCKSWAGRGYCSNTYVAYMRTNCPKSCGICSKAAKECKDSHQKCYVWAYVGECQRNKVWMKDNCKKSCNTCEGQMMNPVSDCVDMNNHCVGWAQKGECNKNPSYMHNYCKKSCNRCGAMGDYTAVTQCIDSNKFCGDWASRGECSRNPLYMNENCKKSCKKCGKQSNSSGQQSDSSSEEKQQQSTANCKDSNGYCRSWAQRGECSRNPVYMHRTCQKSCGKCGGGSAACRDKNTNCPYWARTHQCRTNPTWMRPNCPKSCGVC